MGVRESQADVPAMSMYALFKIRPIMSQKKGGEKQMDGKYVARLAGPKLKGS